MANASGVQSGAGKIRSWLLRSVLKAGIWGSGLDSLLTALRDIISSDHQVFPAEKLEREMAGRGKSLAFVVEEISELLELEYGDRRVFPLLSLLYPCVDTAQHHHTDHFFPYSVFQKKRLDKLGMDADSIEACQDARNKVANLVLLEGSLNISKNDSLPDKWMEKLYPQETDRAAAALRLDLGIIPKSEAGFLRFYKARKAKLQGRLEQMLLPRPSSFAVSQNETSQVATTPT